MENKKTSFSISLDMLIALFIPLAVSVYVYGVRAAAIIIGSVLICVVIDLICYKLRGASASKDDVSTVVTGIVTALMMSAAVPYYAIFFADLFAVILCKHAFGGNGNEIFNGAAAAFLFTTLCFPTEMLSYPRYGTQLSLSADVISDATLFQSMSKSVILADGAVSTSAVELLIGEFNGPMGTGFIILFLISAVFLMLRRSISAIAFCSEFVVFSVGTFICCDYNLKYTLSVLCGGMIVFGMIFLSCDYRTMPRTKLSRLILGIITGLLTLVFRFYSEVENPIVYAVVIAAPLGIELDRKMLSFNKNKNESRPDKNE